MPIGIMLKLDHILNSTEIQMSLKENYIQASVIFIIKNYNLTGTFFVNKNFLISNGVLLVK